MDLTRCGGFRPLLWERNRKKANYNAVSAAGLFMGGEEGRKNKTTHKLTSSRTSCLSYFLIQRKKGSKNILEASNRRQGRQSEEHIVIPVILERKSETAPPEPSSILAQAPTVQCSAEGVLLATQLCNHFPFPVLSLFETYSTSSRSQSPYNSQEQERQK